MSQIVNYIENLLCNGKSNQINKVISILKNEEITVSDLIQILASARNRKVVITILNRLFLLSDLIVIRANIALIHSRIVALLSNDFLLEDEIKLQHISLEDKNSEYSELDIKNLDLCVNNYQKILQKNDEVINNFVTDFFISYNGLSYVDVCNLMSYANDVSKFISVLLVKCVTNIDTIERSYYLQYVIDSFNSIYRKNPTPPTWFINSLNEYLSKTKNCKKSQNDLLEMLSFLPYNFVKYYFLQLDNNAYNISKIKIFISAAKCRVRKILSDLSRSSNE